MTAAQDPYSRVYWRAVDDPKFADVWDDDHALATWLRLLVYADMAWPASGSLYHGIHRGALKRLTEVGLVDTLAGSRYRIHGLDNEREQRSSHARGAAVARHEHPVSIPRASREQPLSSAQRMPSQVLAKTRQEKPSKEETSQDEPTGANGAEAPTNDDYGVKVAALMAKSVGVKP